VYVKKQIIENQFFDKNSGVGGNRTLVRTRHLMRFLHA